MKKTLSHAEYLQWLIFYSVSPFGNEIQDLHNAMVCALLSKNPKVDDFRLCKQHNKNKQDDNAMAQSILAYFQALGG
jgi:hypothetical protein